MKKLLATLIIQELSIQIAYSDWSFPGEDCSNQGFILLVEAGDDVGDHVFVLKGLAGRRHLVAVALHLGDVLPHGHARELLGRGEGDAGVDGAHACGRRTWC